MADLFVHDLQSVYDRSTSGDITLDASIGHFKIRDATGDPGGTLFSVTNNADSTTHFSVAPAGATALDFFLSGTSDSLASHEARHRSGGSDQLDHQNLSGAGTNTHGQIDTHIADGTIHFTVGSIDHGLLDGPSLLDDDHTQYFLLAGRSGGQSAYGSPTTAENLTIAGNSSGVNPGFVYMNSPVIFGSYSGNPSAAYGFSYTASETLTNPFIGGGLNFSGSIDSQNSTLVYESFRGSPSITSNTPAGFYAYTVLQALPALRAGSGASNHNPIPPLCFNAGPQLINTTGGSRTTTSCAGVNFAAKLQAINVGSAMNVTTWTGMTVAPTWDTKTLTSINFGNIIGVDCRNPAQALFSQSLGVEQMSSYYGLQAAAIALGTAPVAAIRSLITNGTNRNFLLNPGGAHSDFGGGQLQNAGGLTMPYDSIGGLITQGASSDAIMGWSASNFWFRQFGGTNDQMRWSNPASNRFILTDDTGSGEVNFQFAKWVMGTGGPVGNGTGYFVTPTRSTAVNGDWADYLLTAAGNLTINHSMQAVASWAVNPVSLTAGTGTINDQVINLRVGGMTTSGLGGAPTSALWVTGRSLFRGVGNYEELTPTALAGDVNDYVPATGNSMRQVWRMEASGAARTATGLAVQRTGDTEWVCNIGSTNDVIIAHQSGSSSAANRVITRTGGNLVLPPGAWAQLWHDQTTDRWREITSSGYDASAVYTPTNVVTDRTYDANSTTVAELADVLGTLIADLQAKGMIG